MPFPAPGPPNKMIRIAVLPLLLYKNYHWCSGELNPATSITSGDYIAGRLDSRVFLNISSQPAMKQVPFIQR